MIRTLLNPVGKNKLQNNIRRSFTKMIEQAVSVYKEIAAIAELKGAEIHHVQQIQEDSARLSVQVLWSGRNLATLERVVSKCDYAVQEESVTSFQPVPFNKNIILSRHSLSGKKYACVAEGEKEKDSHHFIIFGENGHTQTIDLKAADKHGKIYADPEFSCLEWSPDETKLVYVAEKKVVKPTSFIVKPKGAEDDGRGKEWLHRDDWGEQLEGKVQSVVCFIDITSGSVSSWEVPGGLCPAQLVWAPDGESVVGVAYDSVPYRLGLVYCPNRDSVMFQMDQTGTYSELIKRGSNLRTPRFSPDMTRLVFLRSTVGGPHCKCAQLCQLEWANKQVTVIVDIVNREKLIKNDKKFYGVYGYSGLPRRCWAKDSQRVVFSSFKMDNTATYVVNTKTGDITELPNVASQRVLDLCSDWLLLENTAITQPSTLVVAKLPSVGEEENLKLINVFGQRVVPGIPSDWYTQWTFVNDTPHPNPKYSDIPVSCIYVGPTTLDQGSTKRPLICWPHGGPHSTLMNAYSPLVAFFVRLGYSIVFTNYRGSLGFGQDGVDALPGYVGNTDVSDVHKGTLECIKRYSSVVDADNVFLFGGSHGGFLVTHLAGQYPEFYKAVGARNPVIDLGTMSSITDIREWTFVEAGEDFNHSSICGPAELTKMYHMSPISFIDSVKIPILLLIGKNDRRVPPSQGINYYKMLYARGIETQLHLYEDCHPLSKVDVELDVLVNSALWFDKYKKA